MKLREVLDRDRLLLVACTDCHTETPLDPAPIALRLGTQADLEDIAPSLCCPACGTAEIDLRAFSPLERRVHAQLA